MIKKFVLLVGLFLFSLAALAQAQPSIIAVVDFDNTKSSNQTQLGRQMAEFMIDGIVGTGLFVVVERAKMDTVFTEVGFSGSGAVSPESAISMGKMLGAQYLLTGKIITADKSRKSVAAYGVRTKTTSYTLKASARIIETSSGRIAFSGRDTVTSSTRETGNVSVSPGNSFVSLAEQLANNLIQKIAATNQFVPAKKQQTEFIKVTFKSEPPSADVEIDGIFYGNSGSPIEVPSGLHEVKISLPGYATWSKKVMLRQDQSLKATLKKEADLKIIIEGDKNKQEISVESKGGKSN